MGTFRSMSGLNASNNQPLSTPKCNVRDYSKKERHDTKHSNVIQPMDIYLLTPCLAVIYYQIFMLESSRRRRARRQGREDALPHEVVVEAVVLRELGMECGEHVEALPERDDGPWVPRVRIVLVQRDRSLRCR